MLNNIIHILDDNISSKIAAGEVIINPASVVKELLENSIDANSTSITVEIQSGGKKYIRVTDNGSGMNADDIKLCTLKHATSKIKTFDDLKAINTLGFRGEALASISAVSHFTIKSRIKNSESGAQIIINGGSTPAFTVCGSPNGTTVKVKNLFFNLPARRKFLKSDSAETANISTVIAKMIIAHPEISFKYISNDNLIYRSSGNGELKQAIRAVYGKDLTDKLLPININSGYLKITGYISRPAIQYKTKKNQLFVFNGRYFNSKQISDAVDTGYEERILKSHFPAAFLYIYMSPDRADVNIHPAKTKLLFYDEDFLTETIKIGISDALSGCSPENISDLIILNEQNTYNKENSLKSELSMVDLNNADRLYLKNTYRLSTSTGTAYADIDYSAPVNETKINETSQINIFDNDNKDKISYKPSEKNYTEPNYCGQDDSFNQLQEYKIVGQAFNTYILCESGDLLYVIDQHAAHERLNYEKLKVRMQNNRLLSQILLTPIIKKFQPYDFELLSKNEETLIELGFDLDEFGTLTYRFSGLPVSIDPQDSEKIIDDLLYELKQNNNEDNILIKKEKIIKMACTSSIKSGDELTFEEIDFLIREIKEKNIIPTCPHGRPIVTVISKSDLEKGFKRVL